MLPSGPIIRPSASVVALVFSRDGRTLFSAGRDTTIRAWEVDTGRTKGVHLGHRERIRGVSLSPDEKTIVSASDDGTVKLWDAAGPVDVSTVAESPWPMDFGFTREGQLLVVSRRHAADGIITFSTRDPGAGSYRETRKMTVPGDIASARLSANGRRLVLPADDRHVEVWDLATGRRHARLGPFPEKAASFSMDPTGRWLFLGIARTGWELWDLDSSKRIASPKGHDYQLLGMMPDGRVVLGLLGTNGTFLWTPRTRGNEPTLILESTLGPLRYAPEGSLLGWENGNTIMLIDGGTFATKDLLIQASTIHFSDFDLSPDGRLLATADQLDRIKLWDVESHQELLTLMDPGGGIQKLAFSPDGMALVASIRTASGSHKIIAYTTSRPDRSTRTPRDPRDAVSRPSGTD